MNSQWAIGNEQLATCFAYCQLNIAYSKKTGLTFVSFGKPVSCTLITIILVFLRTYRIFTVAGSSYTGGFIFYTQQAVEKENKKENWR